MDDKMKYLRLVSFIKGINDSLVENILIDAKDVMEILMEEINEIENDRYPNKIYI